MNGVDALGGVEVDAPLNGGIHSEVEVDGGVEISPTMPCTASAAVITSTYRPTNPA